MAAMWQQPYGIQLELLHCSIESQILHMSTFDPSNGKMNNDRNLLLVTK